MDPINYLQGLGQLPDSFRSGNEAILAKLGIRQQQQVVQQNDMALKAGQQQIDEQEAYKQAVIAAQADPNPRAIAGLMRRFPQRASEIKQSWDLQDKAKQQSDLEDFAAIYSHLNAGRTEQAATRLRARIAADKEAGDDTSEDERTLAAIESGDPDQIKTVATTAGVMLAAATGDKFGSTYGALTKGGEGYTLSPGSRRYDAQGKLIAEAPFAPEYRSVGAGDKLVQINGGGAAGGQVGKGFDSFYNGFLRDTEGGYADRDGASGAPVNFGVNQKFNPDIDVKSLTPEKAKAVLRERYWKASGADSLPPALAAVQGDTAVNMGVPTAKRLLKESGGDPERYLQLREARYRSIGGKDLGTWLNRNNALRQYVGLQDGEAGGGARVVAVGAPKPGYTMLTPQEVSAIPGLDPNTVYQRSPDGQVTAVGGQNKSQLKPWPQTQLQGRSANQSSLAQIDQAISLLSDKGEAGKQARYAIGPSNHLIPDSVLQQTNPAGNKVRAMLGQIGGVMIHDISGAAVSASEDNRLSKWVPRDTDTPTAALTKLRQLKAGILQKNNAMDDAFSEDQGYRPFKQAQAGGFRILRVRPK